MPTLTATRSAGAPPAVLAAYLRQGRWKSWALVALFLSHFFLLLCVYAAIQKQPDVVLVAPDGASTYVNRNLAGEALVRFLADQRQLPSETTIVHFSRAFLDDVLAVNSTTIEAEWPVALGMMSSELRARVSQQATAEHLVQGYLLSQTKSSLAYEQLTLLEHTEALAHLHAVIARTRTTLLGKEGTGQKLDRVAVDLVERTVPRTPTHPDGLEVSAWRVEVLPETSVSGNAERSGTPSHAP